MKSKIIMHSVLVLCCTLIWSSSFGQISQGGVPLSMQKEQKLTDGKSVGTDVPVIAMPAISQRDLDEIRNQDRSLNRPFRFAYGQEVAINVKKEALRQDVKGGSLYRLAISSYGARSLNLIFSTYNVPRGGRLFLYDASGAHTLGAFTSANNKKSGRLPTMPIPGETIFIEYYEPDFSEFEGELVVGQVSHGVLNMSGRDPDYGTSGACQVDVECIEGVEWLDEKGSVCKLLIAGEFLCSGTILNNTLNDGTPYLLTSNFCLSDQNEAANTCFIFNYENDYCTGGEGTDIYTIAGADLKATWADSDFTLLELSETPLAASGLYYAGWDQYPSIYTGGVGIHHPSGDVKKISTFNTITVETDVDCNGTSGNFRRVWQWSSTLNGHSVTEGGSEGSPLFDAEDHVIGQLHGGCPDSAEDCNTPSNNKTIYGNFGKSFHGGGSSSNRLKDWLAEGVNHTSEEGASVCAEGIETDWNISFPIPNGTTETYVALNQLTASNTIQAVSNINFRAGNKINLLPGFHSENGTYFSAKLEQNDCIPGCYPPYAYNFPSSICLGEQWCIPVNNTYSYDYTIRNVFGNSLLTGSGDVGGSEVCLPNSELLGPGIYKVDFTASNNCRDNHFSFNVFVLPCSEEVVSNERDYEISTAASDFRISPNPTQEQTTISFSVFNPTNISLTLHDLQGRIIRQVSQEEPFPVGSHSRLLDVADLPAGLYFLKLDSGNYPQTLKLIIQ